MKIIDYCLCHKFDPSSYLLKTKCGSPSYAAPEIISCQYYDGFKTDIWCCGIILYAMLCGFLPFEGDDNSILFRNILECDPEMPDWLSISSRDLIIKILNPEPDERITLDEIKRHKFYLKGKKLCKINYDDMNTYVKMRKLKIDRNKVIDDIIKMDNYNNNINNNKEKSNEKINRKNNIKIKYCNTISGNKSKTKPFIKNLNMKNNNSINAIKKKIKNLKIKEKKPAENSKNKNIKINIQKPLLDQNNSSNKNYNLLKEYNHTECNSINPKNVSIKNKFTSLLSRLNSDKKPLFLKIINSTLDRNNNAEEKENEQKKCNIIINQLKENFRKLNNQKKLMNKNNYINITNSSSHIQLNKKNHKIKSFREQLKEVLYTNNNVTSPINSLSVKNRRIRINSSENRNRNKKRKINLINNLYEKPIVYFDNLSININNINVHQKAYNNSLNAKSKIYFDKKLIMKKNKNNDLDYKKRNNTINPKRPRYHLNFNDLVIKSDFNTKDCNEKGNNNIKIRKQIIIKKGKNFDKIN